MLPNHDIESQDSPSGPQVQPPFSNTYELTVPAENGDNLQPGDDQVGFDSKKARFILLASAVKLWPESRIKSCFRLVIPGRDGVDVVYNTSQQKPRFANLVRCELGGCPVCGPWDRLQTGMAWAAALEDSSYHLAMLTLTISHSEHELFADVYERLKASAAKFFSGRWWQSYKAEYGIVGTLRSLEVTHGHENGFHPHYHVILVSNQPWVKQLVLEAYIYGARHWLESVDKAGGETSLEYGFDLQKGDSKAAEYLTKLDHADDLAQSWGIVQEATLTDAKQGRNGSRTELQLLADYALRGDQEAGFLWLEIVVNLAGQTRLKSSRGLAELLNLEQHQADQAAEQDELSETDLVLLTLTQHQWRQIWDAGLLAKIYDLACQNDADLLRRFLRSHGVNVA